MNQAENNSSVIFSSRTTSLVASTTFALGHCYCHRLQHEGRVVAFGAHLDKMTQAVEPLTPRSQALQLYPVAPTLIHNALVRSIPYQAPSALAINPVFCWAHRIAPMHYWVGLFEVLQVRAQWWRQTSAVTANHQSSHTCHQDLGR